MRPPDSMLGHPEILVDPSDPTWWHLETPIEPPDPMWGNLETSMHPPRPNVGTPRDPLDPSECFGVFWGGPCVCFRALLRVCRYILELF